MRKKIGSIVMLGMLLFNNIYAQIAYSVDLYDFDETQIENTDSENPVSNGDLPGGGDSFNDLEPALSDNPGDSGDVVEDEVPGDSSETPGDTDDETHGEEENGDETDIENQDEIENNTQDSTENGDDGESQGENNGEDETQQETEVSDGGDDENTNQGENGEENNTNNNSNNDNNSNEDQNESPSGGQGNTGNGGDFGDETGNQNENQSDNEIDNETQNEVDNENNNETIDETQDEKQEEKQDEVDEEKQEETEDEKPEEVDEETKPEIDWDDLNTIAIAGESGFNGVNVNVIAGPQSFPKGTYLKIDPVVGDNLNDIKQQITKDDVDIIAFNIRFLFDLISGDTVELQPYTGQTVQVTFDYSDNEDFQQAKSEELKIYHIKSNTQNVEVSDNTENNDESQTLNLAKGKRGLKKSQNLLPVESKSNNLNVEELTQITKDISNKKVTIQADSFSIYAIIKTNIPESVLVHYNAGDGKFSGEIQNVDITYNLVNGEYIANAAAQQPNRTGFMFNGRYTATNCETRRDGIVDDTTSNEITVYACYLSFLDKVFSFGGISFTMMDRNLGAESTGDYGYYYQWGNNYGFGGSQFTPAISSDLVQINTYNNQPRGPGNYYSSSNFISRSASPYRWEYTQNDNLWGGNSGEVDRQGPCPDGYHVPLEQEWKAVYDNYTKSGGTISAFSTTLGLPLAGYRNANGGGIANDGLQGWYWTSKAYNSNNAYALTFTQDSTTITDNKYRSYANSVRCFKDTDEVTITFDSNGGSEVSSQTFKWYEPRTVTLKPIPTKEGDEGFAGWFTDSGLTSEFVRANNKYVSSDITLYAKWGCQAGYMSSGDTCVLRKVTVNYMIGEDLYKTMVYARNDKGHYLPTTTSFFIPQKEGNWMFDQWYLDPEFTELWKFPMDNDGLGETVTVYGKFLPFEEKTITIGDTDVIIMDRNLGALEASSGYDDASTDNIGYYYQYGNNYGFPNNGTWDNTTTQKVTNPISTSWSYTNPYSNGLFVSLSSAPWSTNSYTSTWGGYSAHDNPDNYKIGPCPTGYHIPEANEWKKLYDLVVANKSDYTECNGVSNSVCFAKVTGLPFGGWRSSSTTNPTTGSYAYYAASTYSSYFQGYTFQMTSSAGSTATWGGINAFPVRCFKDTERYTLTFDGMGGSNPTYQRIWWWKPYTTATSSRYGSIFSGWYLDTGYTTPFTGYVDQTRTVYARWDCQDGFVMDENGECVTDQYISVTYVANPSGFSAGHFPDGTTQKTLEYKGMSAGYFAAVDEEIQVPEFGRIGETGYMFEGWYTDTSYAATSRRTGLSASTTYNSITLYARYLPFRDKTVSRNGVTFTIMDRNMGALDYSSGYSYGSSNSESTAYGSDNIRTKIGLYYQWGNNFGFPNRTHTASANGTTAAYPNNVLNTFVENISGRTRGPGNYYNNGTFIRRSESPWYWNAGSTAYQNLWGGSSANNPDTDRQGPCPEGYHVPYTTERKATKDVFDKRALTEAGSTYCNSLDNSAVQYCMPAALGLPFAGNRGSSSAGVNNQGTSAYYWSSTAYSADYAYRLHFNSAGLNPQNGDNRSYGFSVRCFKNSPTLTLSFDSNGGSSVASQTNFRRRQARSSKPTNPTRANSNFVGRFVDSELTEAFTFSSTTYVSEDTTLYAKWTCKDGYNLSADGQRCEGASIVTFNATANGGSTSRPMAAFRPGDTVVLSGFTATKAGWDFVGRNTNQTAKFAMDDFVIGNNNVTLYAIYKKDLTATFDKNGNDSQTLNGNTSTDFIVSSCALWNKDASCTVRTPTINSLNTPNIIGYSTGSALHIGTYGEDVNLTISDNIRLYAQSTAPEIHRYITFNPNGNASFTYSGDTQTVAKSYLSCDIPATFNGVAQDSFCSTGITFPDITPSAGKEVLGWSTGANNIQNLIDTGSTHTLVFNTDLTYYAQSQSDGKNFTVTFYGNGALVNGLSSYQTGCSIEAQYNGGVQATGCTVDVPSITRNGFEILGFNTHENDTTAVISESITEITLSGDIAYYVISKKPAFASFERNGNDSLLVYGESQVDTGSFVIDGCIIRNSATSCDIHTPRIYSVNTPHILGYSTGEDIRNIVVGQNQILTLTGSSNVYYAQSQKDSIDLSMTFYVNGNNSYTYSGTTYDEDTTQFLCQIPTVYNGVVQPSTCSENITLPTISAPSNTPIVLGRSDGNTNYNAMYSGGQTTTISASENLDLFAQTMASSVTLTGTYVKSTGIESISYNTSNCTIDAIYNGNGGENQKDYCSITFPTFVVKTGYENPLWKSTLGNQNANTTLSLPITANTTFTLQASTKEYTISYTLNGGSQSGAKTTYTIADPSFTLVTPTKKGYTFLGWTGSNGNEPETSVTVPNGTYGNLSYVANWSMDVYTITYYLYDGVVDGVNPVEYTVETPNFSLINPTKTGYNFGGWTGTNLNSPTINVTVRKGTAGNLSYYARWLPQDGIPYTVYHYLKDPGLSTYSLYLTQEFSGATDSTLTLANFAMDDIPCVDYTGGSLVYSNQGLTEATTTTTIASDGSRKIYLYYVRKKARVYLSKDSGIASVDGAGEYECGEEVSIEGIPKEGYHFKIWDGEIQDSG